MHNIICTTELSLRDQITKDHFVRSDRRSNIIFSLNVSKNRNLGMKWDGKRRLCAVHDSCIVG